MGKEHRYAVRIEWTGNLGSGTSGYRAYGRNHEITAGAKPPIPGSSDAAFRGDPARWNPEDMFVASLSACHQLAYLHLCAVAGIAVTRYRDNAEGVMEEDAESGDRFTQVTLRPEVTIAEGGDAALAERLHHDAHCKCFIANSVSIPVMCEPSIVTSTAPEAALGAG